jgi:hypothetical protein
MNRSYWIDRVSEVFDEKQRRVNDRIAAEREQASARCVEELGLAKEWRTMERAEQEAADVAKRIAVTIDEHAKRRGVALSHWGNSPRGKLNEFVADMPMPSDEDREALRQERAALLDALHRATTPAEGRKAIAEVEAKLKEVSARSI